MSFLELDRLEGWDQLWDLYQNEETIKERFFTEAYHRTLDPPAASPESIQDLENPANVLER